MAKASGCRHSDKIGCKEQEQAASSEWEGEIAFVISRPKRLFTSRLF